jgi:hypothetical protein
MDITCRPILHTHTHTHTLPQMPTGILMSIGPYLGFLQQHQTPCIFSKPGERQSSERGLSKGLGSERGADRDREGAAWRQEVLTYCGAHQDLSTLGLLKLMAGRGVMWHLQIRCHLCKDSGCRNAVLVTHRTPHHEANCLLKRKQHCVALPPHIAHSLIRRVLR